MNVAITAVQYDRRMSAAIDAPQRTSKERILDAAREVVTELGYERTSISEISRRAGLPVGSIYHHFGNKATLLASVAAALSERFWDSFEHTATSPTADIAQRLQEFVDDTRDAVITNLAMFTLNADLARHRALDPELNALMAKNMERGLVNITGLITRILRPGEPGSRVDAADIPAIARVLSRYSRGATQEFRENPEALAASFDDYHLMLRRIAGLV